jgi:hypothetical protein
MQPQDADGCVFRSLSAPEARAAVPLPASAYAAFPIVETDDVVVASVNHAVALAASQYEDVKAEAVRSLAGMATQEQSQRALLAASEGVKVAVACLRAFTPDVHRCAASTLANLLSASSPAVASSARELVARHDGAAELFRLMLREKSEQQPESAPVSPQVLRECARALVALYGGGGSSASASASSPVERPQSADAVSAMQKLRAHYCPVVREYAERLDAVVRAV